MKKNYEKPAMEVTEFRFSEHIAASGQTSCVWGSSAYWSHSYIGCNTEYHPGIDGWIGNTG
ncbi:MAG: hypothetical protein WCN92_13150 [Eubacteriales bacterium]